MYSLTYFVGHARLHDQVQYAHILFIGFLHARRLHMQKILILNNC